MKSRQPGNPLTPPLPPLAYGQLYASCGDELPFFDNTADLEELDEIPGQSDAAEAIRFGAAIRQDGYNVFVLGNAGSGRHDLARRVLEALARSLPAAHDWCYVNDFAQLHEPRALRLPAGRGAGFCECMHSFAMALHSLRDASDEAFYAMTERLLNEAREQCRDLPEALAFLDAVQADLRKRNGHDPLQRYGVSLLTGDGTTCAPVVSESRPGSRRLTGHIEHLLHNGSLFTHAGLICGGALHRANGGFLILDADAMLEQPDAWETLKRALLSHEIRIEFPQEEMPAMHTLRPHPISLDVKVVLYGGRELYYLLLESDPDFAGLFRVQADFEDEVERNAENTLLFARLIATRLRRFGLRHFERGAVARVIEHCARLAENSTRLFIHLRTLDELLIETDRYAATAQRATASAADVEAAVEGKVRRAARLYRLNQAEILDGTVLIATDGRHAGQVNGLDIIDLGNLAYALPVRITATARLGEGSVIDIEREVDLGGALHSKGVLILSAFLATRYSHNVPLSLNASLVFEQSYGAVEGDSASLAELCALLSALSSLPLAQGLAVTGSVNQYGLVQAIGGVNEKIEGFFDLCSARGLTGRQGVLIPASNVRHLMLRRDVVEAVQAGRFHVYAVEDVDQAMELLTGVPAGAPDAQGHVPEGTVNYLVAAQLVQLSLIRKDYGEPTPRPKARRKRVTRSSET